MDAVSSEGLVGEGARGGRERGRLSMEAVGHSLSHNLISEMMLLPYSFFVFLLLLYYFIF